MAKRPGMSQADRASCVADKIIKRYSKMEVTSGAATSLSEAIPGTGTAVAVTGRAAAEIAACMKFQVDMTMCMAAAYGHDLTNANARHMSYLIAAGGTVEKAGAEATTRIALKAGAKSFSVIDAGMLLASVVRWGDW